MPGTGKPICPGLRLGAMPSADRHTDSLPIGTLSVVAHVLRKHGHDADALLRRDGVGVRTLSDPLAPSPIQLHGRLVQDAIDTSGIEHLPLLLGAQAQLDNVGPVRALALNAPTAREALASLLRYARIWYRGICLTLESDQGYAVLAYETDARFAGSQPLLTAFLAGGVRNLAQVFGTEWRPALVRMAQRRPADFAPYTAFFRAPVLFEQPRHEVLYQDADLDRARESAEPQLAAFLKKQLQALETDQPTHFFGQVQHAIEARMLRGHCSNEVIAASSACIAPRCIGAWRQPAAPTSSCWSNRANGWPRACCRKPTCRSPRSPRCWATRRSAIHARVCALVRPLAECVAKDAADEHWPQRNARAGQQVSAGEDAWPERRRPRKKRRVGACMSLKTG